MKHLGATVGLLLLWAGAAQAAVITGGGVSYTGTEGPFNNSGLAGTVPANIALNPLNLPALPQAFTSSVIGGGSLPVHQTVHLNDGSYSNSRSWIGGFGNENNVTVNVAGVGPVSATVAGIDLKAAYNLTGFAFGSDNGNYLAGQIDPNVPTNTGDGNENSSGADTGAYHDRTAGTYYIQATSAANPSAAPDSSWSTLGSVALTGDFGDAYRHLFNASAAGATGFRIVLDNGGNRIDEIELYGTLVPVPEPSTVVLFGLGMVGLFLARRRSK